MPLAQLPPLEQLVLPKPTVELKTSTAFFPEVIAFFAVHTASFRLYGTPTTYHGKTGTAEGAEAARNDPMGFYHGMTVKQGCESFVLCGPPVQFIAAEQPVRPGTAEAEPMQLTLF